MTAAGPPGGWEWAPRRDAPGEPAPPWGRAVPLEPLDPPRLVVAPHDEPLATATDDGPARRFAVVACTVLLLVAVTGAAAAVFNWRNGERWRDLAVVRGERAEQVADQLTVSEQDVAGLEARIRQLANEKAQAEDQREVAEGTTGAVAGAVDDADAVAEATERCATAVEELRAAVADATAAATVRALADEAVSACVAARRAGAELVDELGGLPD